MNCTLSALLIFFSLCLSSLLYSNLPCSCSVTQLCWILFYPMVLSPPGSSVHEFFQARILEWIAIPSLQGIFQIQGWKLHLLCLWHWLADSLPLRHVGSPSPAPACSLARQLDCMICLLLYHYLGSSSSFN